MDLALSIVIVLLSIAILVLVLMQSGKGKELSGTIAGGNNSYFGNGKSSTKDKDKVLFFVTAVLASVFVVCVLVLYLIAG